MFITIFVHTSALEQAGPILEKFPGVPVIPIESEDEIYRHISPETSAKNYLYISVHRGNFIKSCPGTDKTYLCCQYYTINELTNCPLDCSYCILQHYLSLPVITYYVNYGQMIEELNHLSRRFPRRIIRIGTGELTDSLALDSLFQLNQTIVSKAVQLSNVIFEVKTKTNRIDHLMAFAYPRLVVSWSVNPEPVIHREEKKTASLKARLRAMEKIQATSARIGLHFDPIIDHQGWERNYDQLIDALKNTVDPARIAWISLGSFRHPPELQYSILRNHPQTQLYASEFISGMDGKKRYPFYRRLQLYTHVYSRLRQAFGENVFIYFCMESPFIWKEVMGTAPRNNQELDFWFARSLYSRFPDMDLPEPFPENYPEDW